MKKRKYCLFLILLFVLFSTSCLSTYYPYHYQKNSSDSNQNLVPASYKKFLEYENMYVQNDEFQDISFIRHEETFKRDNPFYIYISKSENYKFLRAYFYYHGTDWIFFDKAYLINDEGDRLVLSFNSWDKKETIYSASNLAEYIDIVLSNRQSQVDDLKKVLSGTNVRMRLSGEYSKEYKFSQNYIDALKQTLYMYDFL